jgi:hypothetical protein
MNDERFDAALRQADMHPVAQTISRIDVLTNDDGEVEFFAVGGASGVTRIEQTYKPGMHAHIPYVRVWKGDVAVAEFCQHSLIGVYFQAPTQEAPPHG